MCVSTVPRFSWTCVFISLARSAYLSVFTVCSYWCDDPDTVATMTVRELPHRPSLRMRVSLESRNGTKTKPFLLRLRPLMQLANESSDLLMFAPSRSCCPRLFVSDARSAPARSTSASFAVVYARL